MDHQPEAKQLPVDVPAALEAICAHGKGRCWYCDARLPQAAQAIREGWDVQRIEDHPVASIILVCPACQVRPRPAAEAPVAAALTPTRSRRALRPRAAARGA